MHVKIRVIFFFITFYFVSHCFAQNNVPVISNVKTTLNKRQRLVTVIYDLADAENDKVKILFKASNDDGLTYLVNTSTVSGDVGFPVIPGTSRKIIWHYSDTLNYIEQFKVKIIANDLYKINIKDIIKEVDSVSLAKQLQSIYGIRSHENKSSLGHLEKVRAHISRQFLSAGLYTYRQKMIYKEFNFQNIVGRLPGQENEGKTFIISAHMDSEKKSPGADDNGSGIAGMIEAARILSKYNFNNSIKFIGFDAEELCHCGSKMYVYTGGIKPYEKISGVLNLDMIGYATNKKNSQKIPDGFEIVFPEATDYVIKNDYRGDFIINTANKNSEDLGNKFEYSAHKYVPNLKVVSLVTHGNGELTPELTASDHKHFWKSGYKALHIGDGGDTRNVFTDTAHDTLKILNYGFLKNVVKAIVATMAELGEIQHSSEVSVKISIIEQ